MAGLSDREIAADLAIPFDTVRYQLKLAYQVLGTSNRTKAGVTVLQLGLVKSCVQVPMSGLGDTAKIVKQLKEI